MSILVGASKQRMRGANQYWAEPVGTESTRSLEVVGGGRQESNE
jgi:hypothetical protein